MSFITNAITKASGEKWGAPGRKDARRARRILKGTSFDQGSLYGPGGLGAGFAFDEQGRMTTNQSLGDFQPLFDQLLRMSGDYLTRAEGLAGSLDQTFDPQRTGLADIFGTAAGIASQDPLERGQQVTELLRQRSKRGSQNLVNDTFDRLFASGGLSNQTTREQVTADMRRQLADEDLGFQLAGMDFGEQSVQNAFGRAMGANAQGLQLEQGLNMILSQGLGLGQQATNAAGGLAQLPMGFLEMAFNLQSMRNTDQYNRAGMLLNTANTFNSMSPQAIHSQNVINFKNFSEGMSNTMGGYGMGG